MGYTSYGSRQYNRYHVRGEDRELAETLMKLGAYVGWSVGRYSYDVECDDETWHYAIRLEEKRKRSIADQQRAYFGSGGGGHAGYMYIDPANAFIGVDYGYDVYGAPMGKPPEPKHKCLAEQCKDSEKDFYEGLLTYHKLEKPEAKLHECGNTMCLIEQIKKL